MCHTLACERESMKCTQQLRHSSCPSRNGIHRILALFRHLFVLCLWFFNAGMQNPSWAAESPPNVLLLIVDDLRPDIGSYEVSYAQTPVIDRLARNGRAFLRHYTQVPTCGASRRALLSGLYPRTVSDLSNHAILANEGAWAQRSLPAVFRAHGYRTHALGKISHFPGGQSGEKWNCGPEELPGAWDEHRVALGPWPDPQAFMHGYAHGRARRPGKSPVIECADGPDEIYPDAWTAMAAVETLEKLSTGKQPWLLAVGFIKPHLPFAAPASWHQKFTNTEIPEPNVRHKPAWPSGWHESGEMRKSYNHGGKDPDTDRAHALALRRAYAACVSYTDTQIGRVLGALEQSGQAQKTIVVLWGDHGFHLGEHGIWGKHCLFEEALRSPLIIQVPGQVSAGTHCRAIVETVDIFPSLVDLCGLPAVPGLDGQSLRPWITKPETPTKKAAAAWWNGGQRTVRDDRWRLIVRDQDARVELFDLATDPAASREVGTQYPAEVRRLRSLLPPAIR